MFIDGISIARNLTNLRDKKNISLEQMSKDLSISKNMLKKYEKDASKIKLNTLEKILDYFNEDELIFFKTICANTHAEEREKSIAL